MRIQNVDLEQFKSIWVCDTEFIARPGEHPEPVCLVAVEYRTGVTIRIWADEIATLHSPPFPTGEDVLFVVYFGTAELSFFKAVGWEFPKNVLDLYAEFRVVSNGKSPENGNGLLGAMSWFGINGITMEDKDSNRELILRGGPWTPDEKKRILDYCQSDVEGLRKLLCRMWNLVDTPRAVGLRGR